MSLRTSISRRSLGKLAAGFALAAPAAAAPSKADQEIVVDWKDWPIADARLFAATASPDAGGRLVLTAQPGPEAAGVTLEPKRPWNLEARAQIAIPVSNLGKSNVRIVLRLDDGQVQPALPGRRRTEFEAVISPQPEPYWLVVPLGDRRDSPLKNRFVSMLAPPPEFVRPGSVDASHLTSITISIAGTTAPQTVVLGAIVARGVPAPLRNASDAEVFPFIDEYGQFIQRDWPNKIHHDADFAARQQAEAGDLATHHRPPDWDRYGGWAKGPKREATGFFRVEKIGGTWWMVDPEGRLFWSHGTVRVGTRVRVGGIYHGTPLDGREHYFRLPARNSPLGAFYGTEPPSTRNHYVSGPHAVYDHLEANLFRKYGAEWRNAYAAQSQRRLASWGLNTIANSSDPAVYNLRQTPYTAIVYSAPMGRNEYRIQGSQGNWGRFPDPFDPGWRRLMDQTLRTDLKDALNDPWCLGFFVDNELHWGDSYYLAEAVMVSGPEQYAKRALVADLKTKYPGMAELNAAWGSSFADWDSFLASTKLPDRTKPAVTADLEAFSERVVRAYFQGCREAVKSAAPHHLYLGARFAGPENTMIMRAAAASCDVVSINRYRHVVDDLALPAGLDRPIVIGEFHFGALDSPVFAIALVRTANPTDRARAYRTYLESALRNPAIVGTHWFQYYDQPTSGRFDSENLNAGLLDICDTPYTEMVKACRDIAARLYRLRSSPKR